MDATVNELQQRLMDTVTQRTHSADPLVLLATAVTVAVGAGDAADALVEHYVAHARLAGLSWTAIGDQLGVTKQAARQRFADRLGQVQVPADTEGIALSPRLSACLEVAEAAADADNSVPGTHHLLLGLLHTGYAAAVLDRLGVTRDKVRDSAARLFEPTGEGAGRIVGDGEAEATIAQARRFAAGRAQRFVDTQHVLFHIALDPGCAAGRVLTDLGVDRAQVKKDLADMIPPPPRGRTATRVRKGLRGRTCSFCGCGDSNRPMVAGPGVWICANCVRLSQDILNTGDRALRTS